MTKTTTTRTADHHTETIVLIVLIVVTVLLAAAFTVPVTRGFLVQDAIVIATTITRTVAAIPSMIVNLFA